MSIELSTLYCEVCVMNDIGVIPVSFTVAEDLSKAISCEHGRVGGWVGVWGCTKECMCKGLENKIF